VIGPHLDREIVGAEAQSPDHRCPRLLEMTYSRKGQQAAATHEIGTRATRSRRSDSAREYCWII